MERLALINNSSTSDAMTNSSTIDYNGTGAQTIGALDYYNLNIGDHGSQQITLSSSDTISVAGTFTNSVNNTNIVNTNSTFDTMDHYRKRSQGLHITI